jgi:hypothetical protein
MNDDVDLTWLWCAGVKTITANWKPVASQVKSKASTAMPTFK